MTEESIASDRSGLADANPQMPLVSTIVPAYNSERFLAKAIESALSQTLDRQEIIVVNDGSTDTTGRIADRYLEQHPNRVRVVHQSNSGLAGARNAAIQIARGRYLAMLDSDDVWLPNHLSRCVSYLEAHSACGLVHANIQYIDSMGTLQQVPLRKWNTDDAQAWTRLLVREEHVSCCTTVLRRSVVDQVGPFDLAFNRIGCEDRDLWLRIMSASRAHFMDEVHSLYRIHGDNWSKSRDKMEKAALLLIEKHCTTSAGQYLARRAKAAVWLESGEWDRVVAHKRIRAVKPYLKSLLAWPSCRPAWAGLVKLALGRSD